MILYVLAGVTALTTLQRISHVRGQLARVLEAPAAERPATPRQITKTCDD